MSERGKKGFSLYQGCEACYIALSSSPEISAGQGQTGPSPICLKSSECVSNMRSVPWLSGLKATTMKTGAARKLSQRHSCGCCGYCCSLSCAKAAPASAGLPLQLLPVGWCGNLHCHQVWGRQVFSSHLNPPAVPAQQWLKMMRAWMNLSAPSLPQQDPLITSLCCTSVKTVYLFSFFQAVQFLLVICWGQSFPPTLKLCPFASVEKHKTPFSPLLLP